MAGVAKMNTNHKEYKLPETWRWIPESQKWKVRG